MSNYLFIGYGAVTKKHIAILQKKFFKNLSFRIISSHLKRSKNLISWKKIKNYEYIPDIIVISTRTIDHLKIFKIIDELYTGKIILIEKPLFHKHVDLKPKNKVFVNYNLRYSPIIQYLKLNFSKNKLLRANCVCRSNIKNWRSGSYKNQSTSKGENGSLIYELSHEIDYLLIIFKNLKPVHHLSKKLSKLQIKYDDFINIIFQSSKIIINLEIDIISEKDQRYLELIYSDRIEIYDLIKGNLSIYRSNNLIYKANIGKLNIQNTFSSTYNDILSKKYIHLCNFQTANKILKLIDRIKNL